MTSMIVARDLVRVFGSCRAVDGVTFSVEAGSIFGFLGPNGAGKTTTIKMLTTVLQPTSGTILIDGRDRARDVRLVRSAFGIVPSSSPPITWKRRNAWPTRWRSSTTERSSRKAPPTS